MAAANYRQESKRNRGQEHGGGLRYLGRLGGGGESTASVEGVPAEAAGGRVDTAKYLLNAAVPASRLAKPIVHKGGFQDASAACARAKQSLSAGEGIVLLERYYLARDRYILQYEMATPPNNLALKEELLRREPNAALIRGDSAELS